MLGYLYGCAFHYCHTFVQPRSDNNINPSLELLPWNPKSQLPVLREILVFVLPIVERLTVAVGQLGYITPWNLESWGTSLLWNPITSGKENFTISSLWQQKSHECKALNFKASNFIWNSLYTMCLELRFCINAAQIKVTRTSHPPTSVTPWQTRSMMLVNLASKLIRPRVPQYYCSEHSALLLGGTLSISSVLYNAEEHGACTEELLNDKRIWAKEEFQSR